MTAMRRTRARERQRVTVVLQHHDGARADGACQLPAMRERRAVLRPCAAAIRIIEQPKLLLERQHAPHRLVDLGHGHQSALERDGQAAAIRIGHHVDVHAGLEGVRGRLGEIGGDAVMHEFRRSRCSR